MATKSREMLSVGIDIGTTTSQLVLSRLSVSNHARVGLVPRLDVDERTVLYQSEPHLTPLSAPDEINQAFQHGFEAAVMIARLFAQIIGQMRRGIADFLQIGIFGIQNAQRIGFQTNYEIGRASCRERV